MTDAERTRRGGRSLHGITQDQIVQSAIRIGDAEGLDWVTMRRVAADLSIGTMTLYNYFRNKDELLDGMADAVLGRLSLPTGKGKDPLDVVRMIAHALREMLSAHPSVVRLLTTRTTKSKTAMKGSYEQVLQVLVESGVPGHDAVRIYGLVLTYTLGFVTYEIPRPWGRPDQNGGNDQLRERRAFYQGMSPTTFPIMSGQADVLVSLPSDQQFEWGLETMCAGIERVVSRAGQPT